MKIIILDGYALNPGDLSWEGFEQLGEVTYYNRTSKDEVIERAKDAEILIVNKVSIDEKIMDKCPHLKYIGVLATGYNIIDTKAAKQRNITVTNIPSYSTNAVAQAVFALLTEITNGVHAHNLSVMNGDWCNSPDFCYWIHPMTELAGKTFGIVGFGSIGQQVAKIALSFNMNVIAFTRSTEKIDSFNKKYAVLKDDSTQPVKIVSKDELFKNSDILTLHCPLTEETKNFINDQTIKKMKSNAILINTSRGLIVDEFAVRKALDENRLGAFACDVISVEPMQKTNPLLNAPRCIITPHVAWAAFETRKRLMDIATTNLKAFLDGKPVNTV
ncbi:MAG: D-2-hydroxyacid dehydrogenase [Treponema sp.]|jgi:glycerate dehydrogenase|nr:D-2-hydroxyacid dehydrogenase [Treponema sp.]